MRQASPGLILTLYAEWHCGPAVSKAITDSIDTKKVVREGFCEEMTFELGLDFADPGRLRQRQRPGY